MTEIHPKDPEDSPMRAILLGFGGRRDVLDEAERLRPLIEREARIVASDFTGAEDMSQVDADLAIVLGGELPVVAVNLGRLGFLADLSPAELPGVLQDFRAGKLPLVEHLMFECQVLRNEEVAFGQLGLNELAVQTGPPFRILNVDLYVDSELVTTYRARPWDRPPTAFRPAAPSCERTCRRW